MLNLVDRRRAEFFVHVQIVKTFFPVFSNAVVAESALDRLACSLGGKTMLPHILANVPPMLQNSKYLGSLYMNESFQDYS